MLMSRIALAIAVLLAADRQPTAKPDFSGAWGLRVNGFNGSTR